MLHWLKFKGFGALAEMTDWLSRTEMLFGPKALQRLAAARVAVFGLGGVGSYAAEALARSGVGALELIDSDTVSLSNLNRQLLATRSAVGRYKTDVAAMRIMDINPEAAVRTHRVFFTPETAGAFNFARYDYVVDAIDTVSGKIELITRAQAAGTPVISSMGTGNKLDPTAFQVADIYATAVCPLARVMRRELKKRGVKALKVVYSQEPPRTPLAAPPAENGKTPPGSCAFVPPVAGLILAGEVVKDLLHIA